MRVCVCVCVRVCVNIKTKSKTEVTQRWETAGDCLNHKKGFLSLQMASHFTSRSCSYEFPKIKNLL